MARPSTLKSVLILRFIAAATLPLVLCGWLAYRFLVDRQLADAHADLHRQAVSIRDQVGEFSDRVGSNLVLIGNSVGKLQVMAPSEIDPFLQFAANQSEYFEALYLLDRKMRVASLGLPDFMATRRRDLVQLDFSGLGLLNGGQRRQLTTVGSNGAYVTVSDTFVSLATGKPSVMMLLPLADGFLLGTVNLDRLSSYLQNRQRDDDMVFAVTDHRGTLIAHTDQQLAVERGNYLHHQEIHVALASGIETAGKTHEDGSLLESVAVVRQTGWAVHASLSREVALHDARRLGSILLGTLVAAVLLAGGIAFWQARQVVRPLRILRDGTRGVASGDYRRLGEVGRYGYAELDDLAANFLEMGAAVMERETFLRASEERFRSLLAGMGEGMLIISPDGRVIDCNEAAERIFSLSRREIVGRELLPEQWQMIREDGTAILPADYPSNATLASGTDTNNQLVGFCAPDGRELWLQMNSRAQWSLHGEISAVVLTFADVTRLKVAEASLRIGKLRYQELFQQFSALLEGITDRIYLMSPSLQVVWTNAGGDDGEAGGGGSPRCGCCFAMPADDFEKCPDCPVLRCFASGRREIGELVDRYGVTWSLRVFPVKAEEMVAQVVLIAEDITETLENELQRSRASRLAALGELAAGVAHEINNPISGVINYAQLILNHAAENSRDRDLAQRIIKEGDRIATIVRELLTFAREGSSDPQTVSIREALAEALSLCESQLRKDMIELRIDLPNDLPGIESRNHQLQQLFLNLISNARHALAEKYPGAHADKILAISGRQVERDGRPHIRLKVRDHGTGIPPELLERVLNPFVTTKPAGVGTGLGLSISFDIAKKHGGLLKIASEHGAWTEVTVDLPVSAVASGGATSP